MVSGDRRQGLLSLVKEMVVAKVETKYAMSKEIKTPKKIG
jgi:hypothetical protein